MKVAIIGTGNVGTALGRTLTESGHAVTFAARDREKARSVAANVGAAAADSMVDAVRDADVAILAVPYGALTEVANAIRGVAAGKVVVDATNPMTPDYSGLATAGGPSAAETVADHLGEARVVKAFNTLFATIQDEPAKHGTTLDAFYATDDDAAADTIAELLRSIGFRPVRIGGLAAARELEALALLNIRLQLQANGDWQSSFVLVGAPAAATRSRELVGGRAG